ncbi:MAG: Bifunctional protein GlmU [Promethearchaeota archaeon]|nr:MAG: Bifunctional protein GlmU [Candidatus Lokiarchaeota archaeon]
MKAVILAAGEGTRLKPITSSIPKPMIPLAGKPLLEHNLIGLKQAGIKEVLLIVGYKKEIIKSYFGNGMENIGIPISYITQDEYLGTAHATGYAKSFAKDESFLMMYGDLLVDPVIFKNSIHNFQKNDVKGLISLLEVENPQNYGIISLNSQNGVEKITEKPAPELNLGNLANAGVYIFNPLIFEAIERTELSERNEYELTDSMEIMIEELNGPIYGYKIRESYWNDIGLPWQILDANNYLLSKLNRDIRGEIEEYVSIKGEVVIGENSVIKSGTYIQGPCYIGKNNLIGPNAYIRPGTSIQDNCHIGISEVKNTLVLSNSNIPHFNYFGDSIICNNVNCGAGTKVANLRLDKGDITVNIKGKAINSGRRKLGTIVGPNVKTGINVSIMCGKKIGENAQIGAHTLVLEDVPPNSIYYQDPQKGITIKKIKD